MKIEKLDCPNCGAALETDRETMSAYCRYCEHQYGLDDGCKLKVEQNIVVNNYYAAPRSNASPKKKNTGIFWMPALVILSIPVFLLARADRKSSDSPAVNEPYRVTAAPDTEQAKPQSAPVLSFLENVEPYLIKTLKVSRDTGKGQWLFTYSTGGINTVTAAVPDTAEIPLGDFSCFTGLTELDLSEADAIERSGAADLKALTELTTYIGAGWQDLSGIKDAFADPAQIRSLGIRLSGETAVRDLAEFTGLETLEISLSDEGSDISWLSSLTGLRGLTILSAGKITDYSVLYGMPKLETLEIDYAKELKDIGFIAGMPKLAKLSVSDSAVRSLKPLEGRIGISSLSLAGNNDIADLSAVATLQGLTELEYECHGYGKPTLPPLSGLEHLKKAVLAGNHISALWNTSVTELYVGVYGDFDVAALTKIPFVETLGISSNGAGELYNIGSFSKLTALKSLDLYDVDMGWGYGGDCGLFRLPELESLSLYGTGGLEIDLANIPENTTLKTLKMENCNYLMVTKGGTPVYSDTSSEFLPPAYVTPLFEKLTGLEELYLPSAGLDHVDFAAGLTKLRVLDITDNYVTDISPLTKLEHLRVLYCGKNPVQNLFLLPDVTG